MISCSVALRPTPSTSYGSLRCAAAQAAAAESPFSPLNDPNLGPAMLTGPPNGSPKKEKKIGTLLGFGSYQRAEAARSSGHARPPQPSGGGAELPVKPGAIRPWGRRRPTSRRGGFVASANSGGGEARRGGPGRGGEADEMCGWGTRGREETRPCVRETDELNYEPVCGAHETVGRGE